MKITAKKAAPDVYAISFDDIEVAIEGNDLKSLLIQITRLLSPASELTKSGVERRKEFIRHIKNANDVGLQKFLLAADHEDVLILLKVAENDKALLKKFYGNMSERSRKICIEDLIYKYEDDVSAAQVTAVIGRLGAIAKDLENGGTLVYENVVRR
jgi:hypothetical protein